MRPRYTLGLAAATLLLTGCGASIPDGAADAEPMAAPEGHPDHDPVMPVGEGGTLELDMGDFFFEITGGLPVTGEIEVTVDNVSSSFHDINFAGHAGDGTLVAEAEGGESGEGTALLFPGEVTFWCDVPGHREAGMEDTVTVYATEEEALAAAEEGEIPWLENGVEDAEDLDDADADDPDADDPDGDDDEDLDEEDLEVEPAG